MNTNYRVTCWYVAATTDELGAVPLARRLLGRDVVLWRSESGVPSAFEDRCAHRGFPLADGDVEGEPPRPKLITSAGKEHDHDSHT